MADPAWSKNLACRYALCTGTGRSPTWPLQKSWSGPHREGEESKPMKYGQEKSDLFIIALKPTNNPGRLGAELVEPRERTEGKHRRATHVPDTAPDKRVPEARRLCCKFVVEAKRIQSFGLSSCFLGKEADNEITEQTRFFGPSCLSFADHANGFVTGNRAPGAPKGTKQLTSSAPAFDGP